MKGTTTYKKIKNKELTAQDCALLLCILGTSTGKYPTVEESLSYIQTGSFNGDLKDIEIADKKESAIEQLSLDF